MLHLILGTSGGGKSYEAVVFQILPSLEKGRKVITNLPLNIEAFNSINHNFGDLIELRTKPQPIKGAWLPTEDNAFQLFENGQLLNPDLRTRPYSSVWDYYDNWKHPESGIGALFVIDECQYSIPRGRTNLEVEEYTALHRHYKVDIIFITQSYGKISKAIIDNLQMVYRVRKQTALGRDTHYIRKVQDGVRGEVMSTESREYKPAYFQLYKSHTQSSGQGGESTAQDVKPIWHHWSFIGSGIFFIIFIMILLSGKLKSPLEAPKRVNKIIPASKKIQKPTTKTNPLKIKKTQNKTETNSGVMEEAKKLSKKITKKIEHPYSRFGLHISGTYKLDITEKYTYTISMSQNGQVIERFTDKELKTAGYYVIKISKCSIKIVYGEYQEWITCGRPQHQLI